MSGFGASAKRDRKSAAGGSGGGRDAFKKLSTNPGFGKKVYFIIENCSLEYARIGREDAILTSDDHRFISKNLNEDASRFRPDILHQCLLNLLDSPLNRAGHMRLYFHTTTNVLVEVSPQCRIPRTFKRFCGLMVQLLVKRIVQSQDGQVLMKVVKNPVTNYLPVGCEVFLTSYSAKTLQRPRELVPTGDLKQVAFVVGGIAKGEVKVDYPTTPLKISNYPLSAAITCTKIAIDFEEAWDIF
uniref:18S rRNA (pseudouridine-N1)-methyltransferase n=1 Tax=Panagrellus redivivus TaxID=6233 RepID=A0A7E4VX57_PANRE